MNKSELIDAIAASADISKATAGKALDAVIDSVTGEAAKVPGFKAGKGLKDAVN